MIGTAFLILFLTLDVRWAQETTCRNLISCPCGSKDGVNITVCTETLTTDEVCTGLLKCEKCEEEYNFCSKCPEGLEGPFCLSEIIEKKSRQKRQNRYFVRSRRQNQQNQYQQYSPVLRSSCSNLENPKSGSIRCVSNEQQRTCTSRCLPGYHFEGFESQEEMTLTCRGGTWSPMRSFPACISQGHCDLIVQGSGFFNCTTRMEGTYCDIYCSSRYEGRFFCYPGRPWEPPLPRCMRPKEVAEMRQRCHCQNGGSCDSSGRYCTCVSGWTGTSCETRIPEKKTCKDPGFVSNGFRRNTDGSESSARRRFEEGQSVVYGCVSNEFALQGSSLLTCKKDGTWSSPLPNCIKPIVVPDVTCPDPGQVANADRLNSDGSPSLGAQQYRPGQSVVYTCRPGFALQRRSLITCLSSGAWSFRPPYCIRVQPPSPATTTTTGEPTKAWKFCRDPGIPANSNRKPTLPPSRRGFAQGSPLEFSCNSGYVLKGEQQLICLSSGEWSASRPTCEVQSRNPDPIEIEYCLNPGPVANGQIVYLPSINTRRKPSSGSGELDDPEYPEGSRLIYSCNDGYSLVGTDTLSCKSGVWSAEAPTCRRNVPSDLPEIKYCPNPGPISNGKVVYHPSLNNRRRPNTEPRSLADSEYPEGSRLVYSCNEGYSLEGTATLTCESSSWSAEPPICRRKVTSDSPEIKYCPNPGPISNGKVVYHPSLNNRRRPNTEPSSLADPEYPEGSRLVYSCNDGYSLVGTATLTCESSSWSAEPPTCRRNAVEPPKFCRDPGTDVDGSRKPLGPPSRRGFPESSRLEYSCNRGYVLKGERYLTCLSSGEWSSSRPRCDIQPRNPSAPSDIAEMEYCQNPGPIANGQFVYHPSILNRRRPGSEPSDMEDPEYPEGSRLEYSCNEGYSLTGTASLTCESGLWSTDPPTCRNKDSKPIRYCTDPGDIANGRVVHIPPSNERGGPSGSSDEREKEYLAGSQLQYSCETGFTLDGDATLTCRSTGRWSAKAPMCIAADTRDIMYCGNPGPIMNGRVLYYPPGVRRRVKPASSMDYDMDEYPEGARVEYTCDEDFRLQGSSVLTCLSTGFWSDDAPTCVGECGRSYMQQTTHRLGNGEKTISGEWPWVVSISIPEKNTTRFICGGSVINSNTILTAAHCLVVADRFILRFGKHHFRTEDDDPEVLMGRSTRIIIHPDYNNETHDSDIGLVMFEPRLRFSIRVQPICLPTPETTAKNIESGSLGFVAGWGETEKGLPPDELLLASLPVLNKEACIQTFRSRNINPVITRNMFCAGYADGRQSVCEGDSGSPYVFPVGNPERYMIEGIVSFGVKRQCGLPAIFTRVYQFLPWILKNTQ